MTKFEDVVTVKEKSSSSRTVNILTGKNGVNVFVGNKVSSALVGHNTYGVV